MHLLRRIGLALAGAFIAATFLATVAQASFTPRVSVQKKSDGTAEVLVNDKVAIRFVVSNGGLTPLQRAQITSDRIKSLVASKSAPAGINTKDLGSKAWVTWNNVNICLVTPGDAKRNSTSVDGLAGLWAARLRSLLSMPPIKISTNELLVPVSETRSVEVGGAAVGPLTVSTDSAGIATAEINPQNRTLTVTGKTVGDAKISVTCQGETACMLVKVRKYAGALKSQPSAIVTGNPAPDSLLGSRAVSEVERCLQLEDGATAQIGQPKVSLAVLNEGDKTTVQVPVRVEGGGHIPVTMVASVQVSNQRLEKRPIEKLMYSNNPESVSRYQTLFVGQLETNEPQRLLYHHQNMIGKRFRFNLEIVNASSKPAQVHIIRAIADPVVDTVLVGFLAGAKFLRDYINNVGYVVEIPGNSKYIVYSDNVDPIKTASGILEFRELSGDPLLLRVGADLPQTASYRSGDIVALRQDNIDMPLSDEVYPSPTKQLFASYNVGDRWAFIPVGKHAIKHDSNGKQLFGNYGVIYEIKVEISNPTAVSKKVSVLFEPGAGLAGGVFFVDGKFVQTKYVNPPGEFTIANYQLEPNQKRIVSILTVPLAGSAYPANILVRS